MTNINEERNYRELKGSIRMMKGQEDKKKILTYLSINNVVLLFKVQKKY